MLSRAIVLAAILAATCFTVADARAQTPRRVGRYSPPSRPTLSPYLDYFRRDVGLTDRYNAFVQPRTQLTNTLRQQQADLRSLGTQLEDMRRTRQTRPSGASPTGIGSSFMNYSHFYPTQTATRR